PVFREDGLEPRLLVRSDLERLHDAGALPPLADRGVPELGAGRERDEGGGGDGGPEQRLHETPCGTSEESGPSSARRASIERKSSSSFLSVSSATAGVATGAWGIVSATCAGLFVLNRLYVTTPTSTSAAARLPNASAGRRRKEVGNENGSGRKPKGR